MRSNIIRSSLAIAVVSLSGCSTTSPTPGGERIAEGSAASTQRWEDAIDAPKAKVRQPPVYPFELWRSRTDGFAQVTFRTDRTGHVIDVQSFKATNELFSEATTKAVAKWEFSEKDAGPFRLTFRYHVSDAGAEIEWH
jgi:outer membrane biosynthesis protein TonB